MKPFKSISPPLFILALFLLVTGVAIAVQPTIWWKLVDPARLTATLQGEEIVSFYWDVRHYANFALQSQCTAFYPLWPLLIRGLFRPQTLAEFSTAAVLVSTTLYCINIPLLFWLCQRLWQQRTLTFLVVLSYALSPVAVFRVNGYTESFFSLIGLGLISLMMTTGQQPTRPLIKLGLLLGLVILMGLTRPVLVQTLFAAIATIATLCLYEHWRSGQTEKSHYFQHLRQKYRHELRLTLTLGVGACVGYLPYGLFCFSTRGSFFAPFQDQKLWGKSLGLRWHLLLVPKASIADCLAFYLPILVLLLSLVLIYCQARQQQPQVWIPQSPAWGWLLLYPPLLFLVYLITSWRTSSKRQGWQPLPVPAAIADLAGNYLFWFALYFSVAHSALIFLTQENLYGLARYVFAIPFFWIALGEFSRYLPRRQSYPLLLGMSGVSAIALVQQWISFGRSEWIG